MTQIFEQPLVDTHQHLWDLERFSLPWTKEAPALARSFLPADYHAATRGLKIAQTVYMEVDVEPAQQEAEARFVIDLCQRKDNPMAAAVISGRPADEGFRAYLDKFKDSPSIKGLRQVLHGAETPAGYCLDARFVRGIQLLGERGLSFDLCLRPGELLDADKLVAQCPHTRFIVDHCGNRNVQDTDLAARQRWEVGMKHLAEHEQVMCKISGIVASAGPEWTVEQLAPTVQFSLDTFGPARVMFGGDWPVCTLRASYRRWVEALGEITAAMSDGDRRALFHDNAVRFYGLSATGKEWQA